MKVKKTKSGYDLKAENSGDCKDLMTLLNVLAGGEPPAEVIPEQVEKRTDGVSAQGMCKK
jgi:hypothetical protein